MTYMAIALASNLVRHSIAPMERLHVGQATCEISVVVLPSIRHARSRAYSPRVEKLHPNFVPNSRLSRRHRVDGERDQHN
jgi:hypothetical protein